MINRHNTNINQLPAVNLDQTTSPLALETKQRVNTQRMLWKYFLLFVVVSFIGYGILLWFSVKNTFDIGQLKTLNKQFVEINRRFETSNNQSIDMIQRLETSNNQSIEMIQRLKHQVKQLQVAGNYYIPLAKRNRKPHFSNNFTSNQSFSLRSFVTDSVSLIQHILQFSGLKSENSMRKRANSSLFFSQH